MTTPTARAGAEEVVTEEEGRDIKRATVKRQKQQKTAKEAKMSTTVVLVAKDGGGKALLPHMLDSGKVDILRFATKSAI